MQSRVVAWLADEQSQFAQTKFSQKLASDPQVARIHGLCTSRDAIASGEVGSIGIIFIRSLDLVYQASQIITHVLGSQIDQSASAFLLQSLHGCPEKIATGMFSRMEDVAQHIATMNPDHDWIIDFDHVASSIELTDITECQGQMWLGIDRAVEHDQVERAPGCFDWSAFSWSSSCDQCFMGKPLFDDLLDAAHLVIMFLADLLEVRHPRHLTIGSNDLDDGSGGAKSGHSTQIYGAFGLTGTSQHATFSCMQRIDVAWSHEVIRRAVRIRQELDCGRTIIRRDPGSNTMLRTAIDADRQRCSSNRSVRRDLWMQIQSLTVGIGHGDAEVATTNPGHEIDHVDIDMFSSADEVAFILTTFVVDENDHSTCLEVIQNVWDGAEHSSVV